MYNIHVIEYLTFNLEMYIFIYKRYALDSEKIFIATFIHLIFLTDQTTKFIISSACLRTVYMLCAFYFSIKIDALIN